MKDNREAATNAEDKHYFTGIPCINGHIAKRLTQNGSCIPCENERVKNARETKARLMRLKRTVGEARESKAPFYFTGKPCVNGHISIRRTVSALCEECSKKRNAAKRRNDKKNTERKKVKATKSNSFILLFYALKWVNREKNTVLERYKGILS